MFLAPFHSSPARRIDMAKKNAAAEALRAEAELRDTVAKLKGDREFKTEFLLGCVAIVVFIVLWGTKKTMLMILAVALVVAWLVVVSGGLINRKFFLWGDEMIDRGISFVWKAMFSKKKAKKKAKKVDPEDEVENCGDPMTDPNA